MGIAILAVVLIVLWMVLGVYISYNAGKAIGTSQGYIQACEDIKKKLQGYQGGDDCETR